MKQLLIFFSFLLCMSMHAAYFEPESSFIGASAPPLDDFFDDFVAGTDEPLPGRVREALTGHEIAQETLMCSVRALSGAVCGAHDMTLYVGPSALPAYYAGGPRALKAVAIGGGLAFASMPLVSLVQKSVTKYALAQNPEKQVWPPYASRTAAQERTSWRALSFLSGRIVGAGITAFLGYKYVQKIPSEHYASWMMTFLSASSALLLFERSAFCAELLRKLSNNSPED